MGLSDDRRQLIEQLGAFLEDAGGRQRFLASPIRLAEEVDFPDQLGGDEEHLGFALLRLLDWAGMAGAEVALEAWTLDLDHQVPDGQPFEPVGDGVRMAYGGNEEGEHLVVYDPQNLDSLPNTLGAAALVVAEIARTDRGVGPPAEESGHSIADEFYAVCLGFGVLLANASLDLQAIPATEAGSRNVEGIRRSWQRVRELGELGPLRLGELLAIQLKARAEGSEQRERIEDALDSDARRAFREADGELTRTDLADLELTATDRAGADPAETPAEVDLSRLNVVRDGEEHRRSMREARRRRNSGRPVFRIPKRLVSKYGTIGFGIGLVTLLATIGFIGGPAALILSMGIFAGGLVYGYNQQVYECSDADCLAFIEEGDETCPECGGIVAGELESADDRLEAAEKWREQRALEAEAEEEAITEEPSLEDAPKIEW